MSLIPMACNPTLPSKHSVKTASRRFAMPPFRHALLKAAFIAMGLLAPLGAWGQQVIAPVQKSEEIWRLPGTPWVVFSEEIHNRPSRISDGGTPDCLLPYAVVSLDPISLSTKVVMKSDSELIARTGFGAASCALWVGDKLLLSSFQGNRMLLLPKHLTGNDGGVHHP